MEQRLTNLNDAMVPTDGTDVRQLEDFSCASGAVRAHFRDLERHLARYVDDADVVVGCVAWLTNEAILRALARKRWVSLVVQKEDFLRPDAGRSKADVRRLYAALPSTDRYGLDLLHQMDMCGDPTLHAVRCVGVRQQSRWRPQPRMHHKFAVFCRSGGREYLEDPDTPPITPYAVWMGSFNFTATSTMSLENAIYVEDPVVARAYLGEWEQVAAISEPLDWQSEWVDPQWRVGS